MSHHFRRRWICLSIVIAALFEGCGQSPRKIAPPPPPQRFDLVGDPLPLHAEQRLGSLRFLPRFRTDRIAYSADGKFFATAAYAEIGTDPTGIQIWNRATGQNVTPEYLRGVDITGFAWAPQGARVLVLHRYAGAIIWDVETGNSRPIRDDHVRYTSAAWSPAGDRIAFRSDSEILLLDLLGLTKRRWRFTGQDKSFPTTQVLAFTPDGTQLAIVTDSGIDMHDVDTGSLITHLATHAESINGICMLPTGQGLGLATKHGVIVLPVDAAMAPVTLGEKLTGNVAVSPDGKWLAAAELGGYGEFALWDLATFQRVELVERSQGGVAFSPDSSEIAVADRRIKFLETGSWNARPTGEEHTGMIGTGLVSNEHVWTGEIGPALREWNWKNGTSFRTLHRNSGTAISLALIGERQLAVAGGNPVIDVFDFHEGTIAYSLSSGTDNVFRLIFSKSHNRLVSSDAHACVKGWDLNHRQTVFEFTLGTTGRANLPIELAISPRGDTFVCGNPMKGTVSLHKMDDGAEVWHVKQLDFSAVFFPVAFSPDSKHIATVTARPDQSQQSGIDWSLVLLDPADGRERALLNCKFDTISALAISPDCRLIAACGRETSDEHQIGVWSLPDGRELATFSGHRDYSWWSGFSPDGQKLISTSQDTTAIVWDLKHLDQQ